MRDEIILDLAHYATTEISPSRGDDALLKR